MPYISGVEGVNPRAIQYRSESYGLAACTEEEVVENEKHNKTVALASQPYYAQKLVQLLNEAEAAENRANRLETRVLELEAQLLTYRRLQPHLEAIAEVLYIGPIA
jgi:hypothetical protein